MFRKTAVAAALLFITVSPNSFALGLGEIDMQSALNEPLQANIGLTSATGTDLSRVKVNIASAEAHKRAGLTRPGILGNLKFKVEQDSRGQAFIRVSSSENVHEPFLEFMLELTWPNGRLMRQYTVLVDPPLTMPATPAIPAAPVTSMPRAMPVTEAPARTYRTSGTTTARPPARSGTGQPASSYGPVKRSETLWSIARNVRPDSGVSMEQMMLALQRANPEAFLDNNINNLMEGATLTIPSREEIVSVSARDARAEVNRQSQVWAAGVDSTAESTAESAVEESAPVTGAEAETAPAVTTESRLQLTAPEDETIQGSATAGDPRSGEAETGSSSIEQQLALAAETAEANRAQSEEMQSRLTELEKQVVTMKRLLELKNDQLATMQNSQTMAEATDTPPPVESDEPVAAADAPAAAQDSAGAEAAVTDKSLLSNSIVNKLMDNPILAGLGVLVAMLLGGFLWASTRRKGNQSIFDEEMTLEKRLAAESTPREAKSQPAISIDEVFREPAQVGNQQDTDEGDPLTEADVYLAYGRIQQAEDVLQAALEKTPDDATLRHKLLEVYHAGGNITAFDREASDFRDSVTEEDPAWLKVAAMGYELSPENELYKAGAGNSGNLDFDMDITGMDDSAEDHEAGKEDMAADDLGLDMDTSESQPAISAENVEFNLDDLDTTEVSYDDSEDDAEGLLDASDEVSTKLDLARAYLDMGDPEGARSILDEVLEEGNEAQKDEAGKLIAELA